MRFSRREFGRRAAVLAGAAAISPETAFASPSEFAQPRQPQAIDIGARVEMFVDRWLIDRIDGVALELQKPERREVVLVTDRPWEGPAAAYFTAIQDGRKVRLYYRGFCPADSDTKQATCVAESEDGIHFTRPNLGLFDFEGSKENNIIWRGVESHNFAPFLDTNPACRADRRYKAFGGISGKLYGFVSADGLRWRRIQDAPVLAKGTFDSLNTGFWDPTIGKYRLYSRYFDGQVRSIQGCTSDDFLHWTGPVPNLYTQGAPHEHFYTNATRPCPGAPHILFSFPKRFVPSRTKLHNYKEPGVSDAVLISSRDGLHWDRSFAGAWVRPGLDEHNWSQRSNMPAAGIVETGPAEFSMYISEHYEWPDNRLRRLTIRKHGFSSVHAGVPGGELTTKPIVFSGNRLLLNVSTSAAGSVSVEIQDDGGSPFPGFLFADAVPLFGDEIEAVYSWRGGSEISRLAGKPIRLHFRMADADLFSFRTVG